jgi:hypothetical protein
MSARTPNKRMMWGMYTKVSKARPAAEGREDPDGTLGTPFKAKTVAMTETVEKTSAVTSTDHQGTSGVLGEEGRLAGDMLEDVALPDVDVSCELILFS